MKKTELAGCVILDDYGRILLMHRSTEQLSQWELPGGKVESGETAEAAAVRDLKEELGIDVRLTKSLGTGEFQTEEKEYRYTWFQATITEGEAQLQELDTFDDLEYFEIEELLSLALSQNMQVLLERLFSGEVSFIV